VFIKHYFNHINFQANIGLISGILFLTALFFITGDQLLLEKMIHMYRNLTSNYALPHFLTILGGGTLAFVTLIILMKQPISIWIAFTLGWISVGLLTFMGKKIFFTNLLRPREIVAAGYLPPDYPVRGGSGMPSGHSAEITLTILALTSCIPKNKFWGSFLGILAILVGLSRIILVQHFPSQVIIGLLLGFVSFHFWLSIILKFMWNRRNKFDINL